MLNMNVVNTICGKKQPVYIVAEAGINHNGDLKIAKKMIEKAAKCGVNGIKFQTIFPEELFSKNQNSKLFNLIDKWSFTKLEHLELKKHSSKFGIEFLSTPVGLRSLNLLAEINIKAIKIASGELTNIDLLKNAGKLKIPLIISTGMSTIDEIIFAVQIIKKESCPFMLLHCTASYPAPIEDTHISTIPFLAKKFNVPIGYSDHTLGIDTCLATIPLGTKLIEKHFTLNKKMPGPDQKLSADPKQLSLLVSHIRKIEKMIGIPRISVFKSESKFRKAMRKSIVTTEDISKGTVLKKHMFTFIRPEIGMPPKEIKNILGKKAKTIIKKDTVFRKNMI